MGKTTYEADQCLRTSSLSWLILACPLTDAQVVEDGSQKLTLTFWSASISSNLCDALFATKNRLSSLSLDADGIRRSHVAGRKKKKARRRHTSCGVHGTRV